MDKLQPILTNDQYENLSFRGLPSFSELKDQGYKLFLKDYDGKSFIVFYDTNNHNFKVYDKFGMPQPKERVASDINSLDRNQLFEGVIKTPSNVVAEVKSFLMNSVYWLIHDIQENDNERFQLYKLFKFKDKPNFNMDQYRRFKTGERPYADFKSIFSADISTKVKIPKRFYRERIPEEYEYVTVRVDLSGDYNGLASYSSREHTIRLNFLSLAKHLDWSTTPNGLESTIEGVVRHEVTHMVQVMYLSQKSPEQVSREGGYYNSEIEFDPYIKTFIEEVVKKDMRDNPDSYRDKWDASTTLHMIVNKFPKEWDNAKRKLAIKKAYSVIKHLNDLRNSHLDEQ